jgi:hypothetical protein
MWKRCAPPVKPSAATAEGQRRAHRTSTRALKTTEASGRDGVSKHNHPAATNAGSMTTGTRPPGKREHLAYGLVPVKVRTHRASRTPSLMRPAHAHGSAYRIDRVPRPARRPTVRADHRTIVRSLSRSCQRPSPGAGDSDEASRQHGPAASRQQGHLPSSLLRAPASCSAVGMPMVGVAPSTASSRCRNVVRILSKSLSRERDSAGAGQDMGVSTRRADLLPQAARGLLGLESPRASD